MAHTIKRTQIAAAILLACSTSLTAFAQDQNSPDSSSEDNIERVEVFGTVNKFGALKDDVPLLETARSVSIISLADIAETGALTLDDALSYSSGVATEAFGLGTRGDFYTVRGFDVPEYRDGMQSLSGNYNNTRAEVYTLEQVEVLKGPASVLFGPGSPGGIVNLVTKRPGTSDGNEVVVEVGSHNRKQVAADLSLDSDDEVWQSRLVMLYRQGDTQIEQVNDDAIVVAPSIAYQPSDDTRITLMGDFTSRDSIAAHQFLPITGTLNPSASGNVTSSTVYLGEPGFNQYDTDSWAVTLLAEHQINETWSVDLSSRYRDGESEYKQTWVSFTGNGVPRVDANGNGPRSWYQANGFSTQFQFDARARANFYTGDVSHRLLMGVSHQRIDNRNDTSFLYGLDFSTGAPVPQGGIINVFNPVYGFVPDLPPISRGLESEDRILGVYVHNNMEWEDWTFNLGARFDDVSNETPAAAGSKSDEDATSISASIMRKFDDGVSLYANYSESFQITPGLQDNGERFKPEEGKQIEYGMKIQPTGTGHFISLAYFDAELSNLPNPAALVNEPQQQLGISEVSGFEVEGVLDLGEVNVDVNYTTLQTQDPEGARRASVPSKLANIWVTYSPEQIEGLTAGFGVRYIGDNQSSGVSALTGSRFTVVTPSYTVSDLYVSYDWEAWTFSANVRNLADKDYYSTCLARGDCFPGEQRNVTLKAAYSF